MVRYINNINICVRSEIIPFVGIDLLSTQMTWILLIQVRQQAKSKMDELSIHTIAYLHIHVHNHGIPKVPIQDFGLIYYIALQYLPGDPPSSFKDHRKAKSLYLSRYGEIWVSLLLQCQNSIASPT